MHRHGYKGKKFGREKDQRRALLKGLADSLILHEKIETTITKAKELVPYTEKLVNKAKKGTLHDRRQVISSLNTLNSAHKLVDEIAPKLKNRNSGYFTVKRTILRKGDNTQMASVSFVDDLKAAPKPEQKPIPKASKQAVKKQPVKKTAVKKTVSKTKTANAKKATK